MTEMWSDRYNGLLRRRWSGERRGTGRLVKMMWTQRSNYRWEEGWKKKRFSLSKFCSAIKLEALTLLLRHADGRGQQGAVSPPRL